MSEWYVSDLYDGSDGMDIIDLSEVFQHKLDNMGVIELANFVRRRLEDVDNRIQELETENKNLKVALRFQLENAPNAPNNEIHVPINYVQCETDYHVFGYVAIPHVEIEEVGPQGEDDAYLRVYLEGDLIHRDDCLASPED